MEEPDFLGAGHYQRNAVGCSLQELSGLAAAQA